MTRFLSIDDCDRMIFMANIRLLKHKKPYKHEEDCDRKIITESTKHFIFVGCRCQLNKMDVKDEPEDVN